MGVVVYNLILIASLPLILPFFVFLLIVRPDYRFGWSERLGRLAGDWAKQKKSIGRIWVHAASVGECLAAMPWVEQWLSERPEWELVFSTTTPTGRRLAEQRLGGRARVFFFPIDLPGIPARVLRRLAPDLILLVETELWPNFLRAAARCNVPVAVINGRISPRSYRRYRTARGLFYEPLRAIRVFGMQTAQDARRIIDLGAPAERVLVLGNLKFDQAVVPLSDAERRRLLNALGWRPDEKIIVAGSTHEKEEEMVLAAYERIRERFPGLRLVLAPRHLNRLPALVEWLKKRGKSFRRYSELDSIRPASDVPILLVDAMGKLGPLYGLAAVAFVGGSLVPVGGHNLLEPAALGRAVLFGPFVGQVSETAELLAASGGGLKIRDPEDLGRQIETLLIRPDQRRMMERRAQETVRRHQGASRKAFRIVEQQLAGRSRGRFPKRDFRSPVERWFADRALSSQGGIFAAPAAVVLRGCSWVYQGWQEVRAAAYARGLVRSVRLDRPVISVGNLTLGGTGKTPTVMAVCRLLLKKGYRPAVLSRGYGGRSGTEVRVVSDPTGGLRPPDEVGDEPRLLADRLPEVPVLVSSDRAAAGRYAVQAFGPDVLVLDDGYQHLRLRRDLNLLVMDAGCPFGNGFVLPRGSLRESLRQLKRADAILLTHVGDPIETEELQKILRENRPDLPIFTSRHRIVEWVHLGTGRSAVSETIRRDRLMAVTGIGQPERFFRMLQESGAEIATGCVYSDHYRYRPEDLDEIEAEAERLEVRAIVTTEKDAVRIKALGRPLEMWWAARLELAIDDPRAFESVLCGVLP